MQTVETLQVSDCEYDCGRCGVVHRHSDGAVFETHMDLRTGNKRWIYEAVE